MEKMSNVELKIYLKGGVILKHYNSMKSMERKTGWF